MANPALEPAIRDELVRRLMAARRALRRDAPAEGRAKARAEVDSVKHALGERGPAWWSDGTPDYNRKLAKNTPYASWHERLDAEACAPAAIGAQSEGADCQHSAKLGTGR